MIRKLITTLILVISMLHSANAKADLLQTLTPYLEQKVTAAKEDLAQNEDKVGAAKLSSGLDEILKNIKENGFSESTGLDAELRPSYVVMQGLIELSIAKALFDKNITAAEASIITPKISTPLTLEASKNLTQIAFDDPKAFALYRHSTLLKFLEAKGTLNTIYLKSAETSLTGKFEGFKTLVNAPVLTTKEFPLEMAGAMYSLEGETITVESRQVGQPTDKSSKWAIKFGEHSNSRKAEINVFLKANGGEQFVR